MTPAEAAHTEALKRILAAKESGQHWLDLGDIRNLEQIPAAIGELSDLRRLGLGLMAFDAVGYKWEIEKRLFYHPITDLSPLASLGALEWLDISFCKITDLCSLASISTLQMLEIGFTKVEDLSPLKKLSNLRALNAYFGSSGKLVHTRRDDGRGEQ